MKHGTGISWTWWPGTKGETWTVVRGCSLAKYQLPNGDWKPYKTCVGCYAMVQAHSMVTRFDMPHYRGLTKNTSSGPVWNGSINFDVEGAKGLYWPLHCTRPRTFFLTSMGDLFYEGVTDAQIGHVIQVIEESPQHRFLILTKRPDRMARMLLDRHCDLPPNAWWGTSIEDQASAEWALSNLKNVPSPGRRWISYEPMIDLADLRPWLEYLSWVVIGGASKQRGIIWPCNLDNMQYVIDLCQARKVPVYVKQLGGSLVRGGGQVVTLPEKHGNHNADPQYWPDRLRVQEFPEAA